MSLVHSVKESECSDKAGTFSGEKREPAIIASASRRRGAQMCPLLTVFMSMVMLVCEDVWLSDVEQEFTEDDSWTRPVCWKIESGVINRCRHHVVIK